MYIVARVKPEDRAMPKEHRDQAIYLFDVNERKLDLLPVDSANFQKARSLLQQ